MSEALTVAAVVYGLLCLSGVVHVVRVLRKEWHR